MTAGNGAVISRKRGDFEPAVRSDLACPADPVLLRLKRHGVAAQNAYIAAVLELYPTTDRRCFAAATHQQHNHGGNQKLRTRTIHRQHQKAVGINSHRNDNSHVATMHLKCPVSIMSRPTLDFGPWTLSDERTAVAAFDRSAAHFGRAAPASPTGERRILLAAVGHYAGHQNRRGPGAPRGAGRHRGRDAG